MLNNDALLCIFHLYRPKLVDEEEFCENGARVLQGGRWGNERWWYRLVKVCRRWRYLILTSPSHLGLLLVCTYHTPISKMLKHSRPFPLILDYVDENRQMATKDESSILLALEHRHRVQRIRILAPVLQLQKLIAAMDDYFPRLEFLYIAPPSKHSTGLIFPGTFRAPHLRHLVLINFAIQMRSPFLTTTTSLVSLSLQMVHPSAYFHPSDLLPHLSLMPRLETLGISFHSPVPSHEVTEQLSNNPTMVYVTLPNLRWFAFGGVSAYLEAVLSRISTPLLKRLQIRFFHQPTVTITVSQLLQFMGKTNSLKFRSLKFSFRFEEIVATAYPRGEGEVCALYMCVDCEHLEGQVVAAARIFDALGPAFSEVERLTLEDQRAILSPEWDGRDDLPDRTQWRELLRPFGHVKTLLVPDSLVPELSCSLRLDSGELPLDMLPELSELVYVSKDNADDLFFPFVDARRIAGNPVRLIYGGAPP